MTYTNISEEWGSCQRGLSVEDFENQAVDFGENPDSITADTHGVYFDGIQVAVPDREYRNAV